MKRWLQHADLVIGVHLLNAGLYLYIDLGMLAVGHALLISWKWQANKAEAEALAPVRLLRAP